MNSSRRQRANTPEDRGQTQDKLDTTTWIAKGVFETYLKQYFMYPSFKGFLQKDSQSRAPLRVGYSAHVDFLEASELRKRPCLLRSEKGVRAVIDVQASRVWAACCHHLKSIHHTTTSTDGCFEAGLLLKGSRMFHTDCDCILYVKIPKLLKKNPVPNVKNRMMGWPVHVCTTHVSSTCSAEEHLVSSLLTPFFFAVSGRQYPCDFFVCLSWSVSGQLNFPVGSSPFPKWFLEFISKGGRLRWRALATVPSSQWARVMIQWALAMPPSRLEMPRAPRRGPNKA